MIITLTLLLACIAGLLTGLVYYRSKYWNYLEISKNAEKMVDEFELLFKNKAKKAIKKRTDEIEKSLKNKYNLLAKDLEQDYNNACEEVKNELFQEIEKLDKAVEEHSKNLAMKNILTFSCSCSKDLIPCSIDFSKENFFVCPKCGSKYKIAINANPILIGRSISEEQFANLLEKRLNEDK